MNAEMARALAHPVRVEALSMMGQEPTSPRQIANHLGVPLANAAYHVQVLRKLGVVKLVKKVPRRGAVEHFYVSEQGGACPTCGALLSDTKELRGMIWKALRGESNDAEHDALAAVAAALGMKWEVEDGD